MKTKQEIIQDILSHKYYVHGKCINCGTEFERCTNSRGLKSSCCSDKCFKEIKAENIRRGKERHHYEVFKDDKFYYIKNDEVFIEKRTFTGKTWKLKSNSKLNIPSNAVQIVDKVSAYLYEKGDYFDDWKERGLNLVPIGRT